MAIERPEISQHTESPRPVIDINEIRDEQLAQGLLNIVAEEFFITPEEIKSKNGSPWKRKAIRRFLEYAAGHLSLGVIQKTLNKDRTTIHDHWEKLREEQGKQGIFKMELIPEVAIADSFFSHPPEIDS